MTFDKLINDLINNKLQISLGAHLKKIYPLRTVQIKTMGIEKEKKPVEEKKEVEKVEEKVDEKKEGPKVKEEKVKETKKEVKEEK